MVVDQLPATLAGLQLVAQRRNSVVALGLAPALKPTTELINTEHLHPPHAILQVLGRHIRNASVDVAMIERRQKEHTTDHQIAVDTIQPRFEHQDKLDTLVREHSRLVTELADRSGPTQER